MNLIYERSTNLDTDLLPPMTYRDLALAMEMVVTKGVHQEMVPYLVSALREQAPFLTGQLLMFEILRSANCLADLPATDPTH